MQLQCSRKEVVNGINSRLTLKAMRFRAARDARDEVSSEIIRDVVYGHLML